MSLSKRLRFEVFRRDGFACVYCGRRAPAVTLEVDHRIPRCRGGSDDPSNLVSACWDCNRGKGPLEYEGRQVEPWESHGYSSWVEWTEGQFSEECWPDELPLWLENRRGRGRVVLNFDIYEAAAEQAPASMIYADTVDSVMRRAEAF